MINSTPPQLLATIAEHLKSNAPGSLNCAISLMRTGLEPHDDADRLVPPCPVRELIGGEL